ncbi:hypothetical protein NC652_004658 [Populus alba x Populus x berolinensis]|nr:hypothetical protein NC652_004658 [Populus alba x Populus x berolinensis]
MQGSLLIMHHRLLILIFQKDNDIQAVQNAIRNIMDLKTIIHASSMMP